MARHHIVDAWVISGRWCLRRRVGQPERLKAVGIEGRHELKGVGENLRDHYSPRMKWTVPPALGMTYNDKMRGLGRVVEALRYALSRKGLVGLPDAPPAIRFNFLSAALDREVTLEAMRITRRIMTAPAMVVIATDEIAPGVNIRADDELLDWVGNAETTYHPVG